MSKPAKWLLHIRPEPDRNDEESYRRLRACLKTMLRSFGLRCVSITKPQTDDVAEVTSEGEGSDDAE